jgi:hypothetical protein
MMPKKRKNVKGNAAKKYGKYDMIIVPEPDSSDDRREGT